jgi:hypothetical protein
MIPNFYPADELALIRDRIKRVEPHEQTLRDGYLSGQLNPVRYENSVEIKVQRRRKLREDRLLPEIREDPRFWQETETRAVVVRKAGGRGAPIPR